MVTITLNPFRRHGPVPRLVHKSARFAHVVSRARVDGNAVRVGHVAATAAGRPRVPRHADQSVRITNRNGVVCLNCERAERRARVVYVRVVDTVELVVVEMN